MVRVLLIALAAACGAAPEPAPVAPLAPEAVPQDSLWDQGTFIEVDKEKIAPDTEESFQIYRTASGYRFVVTWKRPAPTGEPSDGKVTLETDNQFDVIAGEMVSTLHTPGRDEVTRSRINREPDGRLVTEIVAADGSTSGATSKGRNDWYIGGTITSFLTALCQADESRTSPRVFPDKETTLEPAAPMPIEGTARATTYRRLTYAVSKHQVVAACEDGKLAGEVTRGVTIVRRGDLALARVLESRFR